MSSSVTTGPVEPDQFSNLREPKVPGLFGFPPQAALALVVVAMLALVIAQVNIIAAVVLLLVAVALVAPTAVPRKDGVGRYTYLWRRRQFRAARAQGRTVLRQGLVGDVPTGTCALPGVGASTELSEHEDINGRPFGLLHWPHEQIYAVVLQANPAGFEGLDQKTINTQLSYWAAWLGSLNTIPELKQVAVTVETTPDSGQRLTRAMDRGRLPDTEVSEFAAEVEHEIRRLYVGGSPATRVWITLSLTSRVEGDDDGRGLLRGRDEMADQIGGLLPGWTNSLAPTGAGGAVFPCSAQHIIDQTRVAFDPSVALDVEEAVLSGEGTGLSWEDAGPVYHDTASTSYRHEDAISRTWQMLRPPTGVFYARTLEQLLAPTSHVARKRVTLLYRPETPVASQQAAERDITAARFKASQGARAKARANVELEAAEQTARQEAQGAPLVRIGMVVTVTCEDESKLRVASQTITNTLAAQARLTLRRATGAQDVGFLMGLPLGLVPKLLLTGPVPAPKAKSQKTKEW